MGINKLLLIIAGVLSLIVLMQFQNNWKLSVKFVDEHDNFVIGKYINQGNKVYEKHFSHHQPIPYIISAWVQNISKPNTTYGLIKQHREVMMLWTIGWWALLIGLFGWPMIITMWGLEPIKMYFEGHLFLAESLVVYPLIYLLISLIKPNPDKKTNQWRLVVEGLAIGFCWWSLAPLWPMLISWILIKIGRSKEKIRSLTKLAFGFLMISLLTARYVNWVGYWNEAIMVNSQYYAGIATRSGVLKDLILGLFTPTNVLVAQGNIPFLREIKLLSLLFLITLLTKLIERKYLLASILVLITGLLNSRNVMLGWKYGYDDPFHLWPWVAGITTISIIYLFDKSRWWKILIVIVIVVTAILPKKEVTEKRNPAREYDIYFSRGFNMSEAIKKIASKEDRLMVIPDETLWYWQSNVQPATRFIFFHQWMWQVKPFVNEVLGVFDNNPPEFLSLKTSDSQIEKYKNRYIQFKYRGEFSELFILKDKWNLLTEDLKNEFRYYGLIEVN